MPVLFAGHGSPMNAIEETQFGNALRQLGSALPAPQSILMISAHWQTVGPQVVASPRPRIIHDFYGFPKALFDFDYPVAGAPALAHRIRELAPSVHLTEEWGLDHGSWSVLAHLFPKAEIPVTQLSLNQSFSYAQHFEFAKSLRALRDENVLIVASGNIIHNLRLLQQTHSLTEAPEWAQAFDRDVAEAVLARDFEKLVNFEKAWPKEAALAVPTPEHYVPLLYAAALAGNDDDVSFPLTGFQMGAISMRSVLWQATK
jgi:4,5-DOPA dioxygenase extradiol